MDNYVSLTQEEVEYILKLVHNFESLEFEEEKALNKNTIRKSRPNISNSDFKGYFNHNFKK